MLLLAIKVYITSYNNKKKKKNHVSLSSLMKGIIIQQIQLSKARISLLVIRILLLELMKPFLVIRKSFLKMQNYF